MSDPEAAARVTKKPAATANHPVQPASADPGSHRSRARDKGVSVLSCSSGVEHPEQIVLQDHLVDTQRSEAGEDLLSKGSGLFAGHRNQG